MSTIVADREAMTALHEAAQYTHSTICQSLISLGAIAAHSSASMPNLASKPNFLFILADELA